MATDLVRLICWPVEWPAAAGVIAGSLDRPCADCGRAVWVAPSGVALAPDRIVCLPCYAFRDRGPMSPPTVSQVAEILAHRRARS